MARGEVASPLRVDPVRGGEALNPGLRRAVRTARGGGHRVPDQVRQPMEQALATDFGQVRVHTGRLADGLNRTLSARAFTTGRDIFVRGDEYDPSSQSGRALLAHELTHVAQQGGASPGALVQRAPSRKKHAKTYTDPNIPGATLRFICPKRGGGEAYKVVETGVTFVYYEDGDTYEVDGVPVKPTRLIPDESLSEELSEDPPKSKKKAASYESSSETSEDVPKKPKKKAPPPKKTKRKHESSEESSEDLAPKKKKKKEVPKKKAKKPPPKKKDEDKWTRRSATFDPFFSDYSSSEDDSAELTYEEQFEILTTYGEYKPEALGELSLPKSGKVFVLDNPHIRKSFAAHRTTEGDKFVDIDRLHTGQIGHQFLNLQSGRGHFVTAGGNPDRPAKMKEPPADYRQAFGLLKEQGKDKNARKLLAAAGDKSEIVGGKLSNRQVAAIVLHAMNNPFSTALPRTQLTESLGKLLGIFMSETARAFEATKGAYDASVLIKAGLQRVIDGTVTLDDVFFSGTGGSESMFLGAPSKEHSPSDVGGAEQLREPLAHKPALRRQMSLFPTRKRDFKAFINRSKTGTAATLPKVTKPEMQRAKQAEKASQLKAAKGLLERARGLTVPPVGELLEWLAAKGPLNNLLKAATFELAKSKGNKEATAAVNKAITILKAKRQTAYDALGM